MLRNDIDAATMAWTDGWEGKTALILETEWVDGKEKYWVRLTSIDGDMVTQARYDTLKDALHAFSFCLP